ncbi:MAG: ABC transporter ATP-binding protein [Lachnospiraceae bacterium]|nr:ABC transporter ATP-binding protein [Lachnospiraceae bacterium]
MNKTITWLWRVTGRKKGYIAALTLIQGLSGVIGVVYALLLRSIVDSAVGKNAAAFRHYVLLIILLVLVQLAVSAVIRWLNELAKSDIENMFKQRLIDMILRKDYASVAATHTAEWLNRLTNDTTVVASGAVEILPGLAGTVVRMISALVMIIALDRWFAYILIPGGVVLIILSYAFRGALKRLHKNIQESDGRLRVFLQERLSSLMVIKAFSAEKQTSRGAAAAMDDHKKARLRRNRFSNVANIGFGTAMQGMYLIGVIYCAHGIMTGRVTYGTLTAVMQLIGQVQGPFANISGYLPHFYAMTASAERLMEVEAFAEEQPSISAQEASLLYVQLESFGLRDASFTYTSSEDSPVVLNKLNLEIKRGEIVAFTGHSGCGKSTVLKLFLCMYPLDAGERYLLCNGRTQPLTSAERRLFAYVPQGNVLMNGTIRDVVCFAEAPDEARLKRALPRAAGTPDEAGLKRAVPRAAGTPDEARLKRALPRTTEAPDEARLKRALSLACADEFVDDLDAQLGERGTGLSEGQMQRLALARAIYADAPILLLDESTSALDEATERHVLENLKTLTDKTVIIVTHRKAALSICDRVIDFAEM